MFAFGFLQFFRNANILLIFILLIFMLAKDLVSRRTPYASIYETGWDVLDKMRKFELFHLPVINNGELMGIIAKSDIENAENMNMEIRLFPLLFTDIFVNANQHFLYAISSVLKFDLSLIPIINADNYFIGSVTTTELLHFFTKFIGVDEQGGIIVLELDANDYVLTEIAQIIESNDAKILNVYVSNIKSSNKLNVTLKLNTIDLSSIIKTFDRYEYDIKYAFGGDAHLENLYKDRLDELIKYLNV